MRCIRLRLLVENARFAQAVIDAGLTWVGPSPAAIRGIGDKLAAKRVVKEVGVPALEASSHAAGRCPGCCATHRLSGADRRPLAAADVACGSCNRPANSRRPSRARGEAAAAR
jgi:hypothetical protein